MIDNENIAKRNSYLISLFNESMPGRFHVIDLPHKPKILTADYCYMLSAHIANFKLLLKSAQFDGNVMHELVLKPTFNFDLNDVARKLNDWIANGAHKRIYTIKCAKSGMFIVGFNHFDVIAKKDPYPVFAKREPHIYYSREAAQRIFDYYKQLGYELTIN